MATNLIETGEVITVEAPAAVTSGGILVRNNIIGVVQANAASGAQVAIAGTGVVTVPKSTVVSEVFAIGANVHWDATNARATISATSNLRLGVARAAATPNTVTTVDVLLPGSCMR